MADHDSFYHRLFAHPVMVRDLLREFVDPDLLQGLDLDQMKRENVKYYDPRTGEKRRGDVVWRIHGKDGQTAFFILLLLEFQSDPQQWMILRILVYIGLLWQQIVDEGTLVPGQQLPPVLPVVLYNGQSRWEKPASLRELIALPEGSLLWTLQPDAHYFLIDESAFPKEALALRDSLTAKLFQVEHLDEMDDLKPLMDALLAWFRTHPEYAVVKSLFAELLGRTIRKMSSGKQRLALPEDFEEVKAMLSERVEVWRTQLKNEGRQEGEQIGAQKGRLEGTVLTLLRLIAKKFGPTVPAWVSSQVHAADEHTLEIWTDRILDATSLEEVFMH
jgi:predicted transposase YdaD